MVCAFFLSMPHRLTPCRQRRLRATAASVPPPTFISAHLQPTPSLLCTRRMVRCVVEQSHSESSSSDRHITSSTRVFEKPQMNAKRVCAQLLVDLSLGVLLIVLNCRCSSCSCSSLSPCACSLHTHLSAQVFAPITTEKVQAYHVDSSAMAKNFELHAMFSALQISEGSCQGSVRAAEAEVCVCLYVCLCVCVSMCLPVYSLCGHV